MPHCWGTKDEAKEFIGMHSGGTINCTQDPTGARASWQDNRCTTTRHGLMVATANNTVLKPSLFEHLDAAKLSATAIQSENASYVHEATLATEVSIVAVAGIDASSI
jgi:hypothetical protein